MITKHISIVELVLLQMQKYKIPLIHKKNIEKKSIIRYKRKIINIISNDKKIR